MVASKSLLVSLSSIATFNGQGGTSMKKIFDMAKEKLFFTSDKDDDIDKIDDETKITILGEIVGATNLVAAKREKGEVRDDTTQHSDQQVGRNELINSFCVVYWGNEVIHRTKVIRKNNNPIFSCDTGGLFLLHVKRRHLRENASLRIEVFDMVSKKQQESIGEVIIEGSKVISEEWCNQKRRTINLTLIKETNEEKERRGFSTLFYESVTSVVSVGMSWFDCTNNTLPVDNVIDDDDSLYGRADSWDSLDNGNTEIDDGFVFGKNGALALRFREASEDDIKFMRAVDLFDRGYKSVKRSKQQILSGVKNQLDGKLLASLITENDSSIWKMFTCQDCYTLIDYSMNGRIIDNEGVQRRLVKPEPDPELHLKKQYLTEAEMKELANGPSRNWIEAGSGSLGRVYVEILSCEGLKGKSLRKVIGLKADALVSIIYEDCLVETDIIPNCNNPFFMPWTKRAFVFNTMNTLSSLYVGVFDQDAGPHHNKGIGRVTIDLHELKPYTKYTLKYKLYSSSTVSSRKPKGSITMRVQVEYFSEKESILSVITPPTLYVNVRRRNTLALARYTCYGKYREDVYNMKVIRGYIDEILEYVEQLSDEINYSIDSLLFWRGQVPIFNIRVPLYSVMVYVSSIYVTERPHLFPSYLFFCCAWILLIISGKKSNYPAPMYQSKSFLYHLRSFFPDYMQRTRIGVTISSGEGQAEVEMMHKRKKRRMENNQRLKKQIADVRRQMQKILAALTDLSMTTSEDGANINPLSKLLPVQLLLRDLIFYVRFAKSLITCHDSAVTFLLISSLLTVGIIFLFIPFGYIFHWAIRVIVWIFLGPWMKLGEMAAKRHGSTRQMHRIVDGIKEREQQRLLEARINKEEAMKLKATRSMRFGRFVIGVPSANIMRFHDQPLPESHAEQIDTKATTISNLKITHYIPGQKHHGVMIPDLHKNNRINPEVKKNLSYSPLTTKNHGTNICRDENDFKIPNDLSFITETSTRLPRVIPCNIQYNQTLETAESVTKDKEGFEVVPKGITNKPTRLADNNKSVYKLHRKSHYFVSRSKNCVHDEAYCEERDEYDSKKCD